MANLQGFDANAEENAGFKPIPAGDYLAIIIESQEKLAKSGSTYLSLTFEIREGQHKGRRLWSNLSINHPNQQPRQIARGHLSAICRAVNVPKPMDTVELHNLPLIIKVACKNSDYSGQIENEIKSYKARDGAPVAQPKQPTAFSTGSTPPPWAAKQPAAAAPVAPDESPF